MQVMMNGTAMVSDAAVAKKFPQGWKVRCLSDARPWASIRPGAHAGEMTNIKWVKSKAMARAAMAECELS